MTASPAGFAARALIAALFCIAAFAAQAQDRPADETGRFILRKADDGWFRVDKTTGQASLCKRGGAGFTCEMVPDDRNALLDEIARLSAENAMLRASAGRKDMPGKPDTPVAGKDGKDGKNDDLLELPTKEDIDRMMSAFRTMFERFVAMVQDLQKEFSEDAKK